MNHLRMVIIFQSHRHQWDAIDPNTLLPTTAYLDYAPADAKQICSNTKGMRESSPGEWTSWTEQNRTEPNRREDDDGTGSSVRGFTNMTVLRLFSFEDEAEDKKRRHVTLVTL